MLWQAASLIPLFKFPFLASPLIFMLIYVWSRNFPTASVSIMGLISVEVHIQMPYPCIQSMNCNFGLQTSSPPPNEALITPQ